MNSSTGGVIQRRALLAVRTEREHSGMLLFDRTSQHDDRTCVAWRGEARRESEATLRRAHTRHQPQFPETPTHLDRQPRAMRIVNERRVKRARKRSPGQRSRRDKT